MADLKTVYQAETIDKAERALGRLEQKWGAKYPKVIESWRRNWSNLSLFFGYSKMIRKVMYTTNAIEAFHRQLRRVTKTKGSFTSDSALMKLLFLVQRDVKPSGKSRCITGIESWPNWPSSMMNV